MDVAAKGRRLENRARKILEKAGYIVIRSARSKGTFDLVAFNKLGLRLIQVKANRWPDLVEMEEIINFQPIPSFTSKEVWRFDDRRKDPSIRTY